MKPKLLALTAFCFIFATIATAQIKIKGVVIDEETQDIIEFANIALLKHDSTFVAGVSSDSDGMFTFENIQNGNYILSTTFVGYVKTYNNIKSSDTDIELGKVTLKSSDIALSDITVTANGVIQKSDRKIIFPSDAQIKAANSGVTLLRNLQLSRIVINPINNTITVPEGGAVQLRINGIEVTSAEVVAIQPEDIIRIEYHDSPGMRYGNAPAVIDYIVKRKESGGSLSTNLTDTPMKKIGFADDYFSAKMNHKKSEFSVNAHWRYRDIKWTRENTETFVFPSETLQRTEQGEPTKFKENNLNFSANYSLNEVDKYMFNARIRYYDYDMPNSFSDRNSTLRSSDSDTPLSILERSSEKSKSPSLDLYYQRNLKNDQLLIFNAVGTYIDSKSNRLYQESRSNIPSTNILSDITGDKYSLIAEGIYERKMGEGKLSGGLKHFQSYTKNIYSGNVASNTAMIFAESSAYAEYLLRKNKFEYALSLGIVRTYNSQGGSSSQKYILRPNVRVGYNFNDHAYIRYNGFISSYPPSLSNLNNVVQEIDSLQIRRGNPNLKTVTFYRNTLNAGYNKGIFGVELYVQYNYDHKPMMEQTTFENIGGEDRFVRMEMNHKGFHRINAETTFKLKPIGDYISLSLSPSINRYISYGNDYTHTYTYWRMRGSLSARYKKWSIYSEVYSRWNSLWGESLDIGERFHTIMVGYNAPKWSLSGGVLEPFTKKYKQSHRNLSDLASSRSDVFTTNLQGVFTINFTMNLNFGRQFNAGNKRLNNADNDAGIMSGSKK